MAAAFVACFRGYFLELMRDRAQENLYRSQPLPCRKTYFFFFSFALMSANEFRGGQ